MSEKWQNIQTSVKILLLPWRTKPSQFGRNKTSKCVIFVESTAPKGKCSQFWRRLTTIWQCEVQGRLWSVTGLFLKWTHAAYICRVSLTNKPFGFYVTLFPPKFCLSLVQWRINIQRLYRLRQWTRKWRAGGFHWRQGNYAKRKLPLVSLF